MYRLKELLVDLASAVVMADATDQHAFADLQRRFRAVSEAALETSQGSQSLRSIVQRSAKRADKLLGRVLTEGMRNACAMPNRRCAP